MKKLVLLRHGESTWNAENRFTGWKDVELTPKGLDEAKAAGTLSPTWLDPERPLSGKFCDRGERRLLAGSRGSLGRPTAVGEEIWQVGEGLQCGASAHRRSSARSRPSVPSASALNSSH